MAGNGKHPAQPTYRLRDLVSSETRTIELSDGNAYPMSKLDWAAWETVERMENGTSKPTEIFQELRKILPSAPVEVLRTMSLEEACAVIFKAAESVKAVASDPPPNSEGESQTEKASPTLSPSSA